MTTKPQLAWTEEEKNILHDVYPKTSLASNLLPLFPGRTLNQIRSKARHLGLKRCAAVGEQTPLPLSETQAAYIAGLIDGEGTISINIYNSHTRSRGTQCVPSVAIFNTNADLLQWLVDVTGLASLTRVRKNPTLNSKTVYEWKIKATANVARLLRSISPYLVIKRRQAELVLEFCEARVLYKPMTSHETTIIQELRRLNKRGTD